VCRNKGWNRSRRVCFLDRSSAYLVRTGEGEGDPVFAVDRESILSILPDVPDLLHEIARFRDLSDRALCFVPLVPFEADELISREADAETYGIPPRSRIETIAFRVIRSEKHAIRAERPGPSRPKEEGGPDA
jgi:hypothetical protein